MRGRKSINTVTACIAACVAAVAQPSPKQAVKPPPKQQHEAPRVATLGPGAEFLGWRGETAVFREETYRPDGASRVAYYSMMPGSRVTAIPSPKTGEPAGPESGKVLLSDYIPAPGEMATVFQLEADAQEVAALGSAIVKWSEEGSGKTQRFPVVHAELIVRLVRAGKEEAVWRQRRDLTATAGEGGYIYDPPKLRFAVLSPAGSTLLAELVNGAGSEFIRIAVQKKQ
jgi:hypothetical protein